jgi:hypothetical protein
MVLFVYNKSSVSKRIRMFKILILLIIGINSAVAMEESNKLKNINVLKLSQTSLDNIKKNIDQYIGLEYIFAEPLPAKIESKWGHTMLRFVAKKNTLAKDYMVSFLGRIDGEISIKRGIMGGYPVMPKVKQTEDFWKDYVVTEKRYLKRVIIPVNKAILENLILWVEQIVQDHEVIDSYTFINHNCSVITAEAISAAGLNTQPRFPFVPTDFHQWLNRSLLVPYPTLMVKTNKMIWNKISTELGVPKHELQAGRLWPHDAFQKLQTFLTPSDLFQLLSRKPELPLAITRKIQKVYRSFWDRMPLLEQQGFEVVPENMYKICTDENCINKIISLERNIWPYQQIQEKREGLEFIFNNFLSDDSPIIDILQEAAVDNYYSISIQNSDIILHQQILRKQRRHQK